MSALEELWKARPVLGTIRQHARSRRVSPWSVLGATLATIVSRVDPMVSLPAIVGGRGSCNLFVALVGVSGGGKGASIAAAHDLIDVRADRTARVAQRTLGSGEGISAAFVERVKTDDGFEVVQHTDGVLFEVAEVDTLAALGGRSGSSLMPELRKMWSGERLGFQNRDRATSLPVDAHSYRASLIVGVQPERSAALLDDAAGGTPQRFVWFSTEDPDAPETAPGPPEPITWNNPTMDVIPFIEGVRGITVCDTAWNTIEQAQVQRLRGIGDALDGHALLSRLKLAAALALLETRGDVNDDDWHLAGLIMQHSDQTRQKCRDALRAASLAVNTTRAELRAEALVKADDHMVTKCAERILGKLTGDWTGAGKLKNTLSRQLREHFDLAIAQLMESGAAEVLADEYQGQPRTRYRLTSPSGVANPPTLPVYPQIPRQHWEVGVGRPGLAKPPTLHDSADPEVRNKDIA